MHFKPPTVLTPKGCGPTIKLFTVLIRENLKVSIFADVITTATLVLTYFKTLSVGPARVNP